MTYAYQLHFAERASTDHLDHLKILDFEAMPFDKLDRFFICQTTKRTIEIAIGGTVTSVTVKAMIAFDTAREGNSND